MNLPLIIASALFCVFSRALLNSIDRSILQKPEIDFLTALLWNALFPLASALLWIFLWGDFSKISLFDSLAILNGLASQIAGTGYSFALGKMKIRSIISVCKGADLILPLVPFVLVHQFAAKEYFFSILTTCSLLPVIWSVIQNRGISTIPSLALIGGLLFQVTVTQLIGMSGKVDSWSGFSSTLVSILFWRTIFIVLPILIRLIAQKKKVEPFPPKIHFYLAGRGIISFFSQMAFFGAVIGKYSLFVWPILNSGPLLSSFCAHILIREKIENGEKWATILFSSVILFYIYWNT